MELKIIPVKGDPYTAYFTILSGIFKLTPQEQRVAAELLKRYEALLKEASPAIANEILFSVRVTREIRELLGLKDAAYNNLKSSLHKKGILKDRALAPHIRLTELQFTYVET